MWHHDNNIYIYKYGYNFTLSLGESSPFCYVCFENDEHVSILWFFVESLFIKEVV